MLWLLQIASVPYRRSSPGAIYFLTTLFLLLLFFYLTSRLPPSLLSSSSRVCCHFFSFSSWYCFLFASIESVEGQGKGQELGDRSQAQARGICNSPPSHHWHPHLTISININPSTVHHAVFILAPSLPRRPRCPHFFRHCSCRLFQLSSGQPKREFQGSFHCLRIRRT